MSVIEEIVLSPDQEAATDEIVKRWERGMKQTTLGGLAGTGKTTILKVLAKLIGSTPQYLAPTGKAAEVLRQKGMTNAETIHSFIYNYLGLHRNDLTDETSPIFEDKGPLELDAPMIVVDEASMVNTSLYNDLMEKGYHILFVGDHGQLPPIGGDPGLMSNPDVKLEKIHRQAEGNPIIQLAHRVRNEMSPVGFVSDDARVSIIKRGDVPRIVSYAMESNLEQIIVGFNKLRCNINRVYRKALGFNAAICVGEKMICLKNNRNRGIFNGMMFEVTEVVGETAGYVEVKMKNLASGYTSDQTMKVCRGALLKEKSYDWDMAVSNGVVPKDSMVFDYSYAITAHKSQGSQWDSVLVLWDVCKYWSMPRWGYTAITRASDRLVVAV